MKSLKNFLTEMHLREIDWYKYKYIKPVIDALCTNNSIRLGDKGDKTIEITSEMSDYFKTEFSKYNIDNITFNDFNNIVKKYNLSWTKIFKGVFSGYIDGIASGNKGNAFELDFFNNFSRYSKDLADFLHISEEELFDSSKELCGGKNSKRPLMISNKEIYIGTKNYEQIGNAIADIKIINDKKTYNLSLKHGNKATLCNTGIKLLFTEQSFNKYKETGIYTPEKEGQLLLDFFGIDANRFASVFVNYKGKNKTSKKSIKYSENVTHIAKTKQFNTFLKSVIGCGYILVHQSNKGKVTYLDLSTENDLNKLIGNIKKMTILYPEDGNKKAVDILLETSNINILFNFRSKQGTIYPCSFMADYSFKK